MSNDEKQTFDKRLNDALERSHSLENADTGKPQNDQGETASGLAIGMRIGIEFTTTIVVGAFVGWWLDKAFGTAPWILIVLLFLGFGAGLANVYRVIYNIQEGIGLNRPKKP